MTRYEFNALPRPQQLRYLFRHGTHLARRCVQADSINLYHLPSNFFAEVHYDAFARQMGRVRSLGGAAPLDAYAAAVRLPEEWT